MNIKEFQEKLTEDFLNALDGDWIGWRRNFAQGRAVNAVTGKAYSGVNAVSLSFHSSGKDPRFATFRQIRDAGWRLRKGSKGFPAMRVLVFDKKEEKSMSTDKWHQKCREMKGKKESIDPERFVSYRKFFHVFSAEDIDGIDPYVAPCFDIPENEVIQRISDGMGVPIVENSVCRYPHYSPEKDSIAIPEMERFSGAAGDYYGKVLHELGHATGAEKRLNRSLKDYHLDMEARAYEELIAEISSAFMGYYVPDVNDEKVVENSKEYIQSWGRLIRDNKNVLFQAIREAEKASSFMVEAGGLEKISIVVKNKEKGGEKNLTVSRQEMIQPPEVIEEEPIQKAKSR